MKAIPVIILLSVTVAFGVFMAIQYLKRQPLQPIMIGLHFLCGAASLEILAMLLRGAPDGTLLSPGGMIKLGGGLVVLAMLSGILVPMLGRDSRRTMNTTLAVHAACGALGFALLVIWSANRAA